MRIPFEAKAAVHWTKDREDKLTSGKNLLLKPSNAAWLLRVIGLLNADASMAADNTRKFLQINHMLTLLKPQLLAGLLERLGEPRLFDDLRLVLAGRGKPGTDVPVAGRRHVPAPRPYPIAATGASRAQIERETDVVDDAELRALIARVRIAHDR